METSKGMAVTLLLAAVGVERLRPAGGPARFLDRAGHPDHRPGAVCVVRDHRQQEGEHQFQGLVPLDERSLGCDRDLLAVGARRDSDRGHHHRLDHDRPGGGKLPARHLRPGGRGLERDLEVRASRYPGRGGLPADGRPGGGSVHLLGERQDVRLPAEPDRGLHRDGVHRRRWAAGRSRPERGAYPLLRDTHLDGAERVEPSS